MTFDEIWKQLERKRPELTTQDAIVEIRSVALKCLLRQVFEIGQKSASSRVEDSPKMGFDDFLDSLGKKRA